MMLACAATAADAEAESADPDGEESGGWVEVECSKCNVNSAGGTFDFCFAPAAPAPIVVWTGSEALDVWRLQPNNDIEVIIADGAGIVRMGVFNDHDACRVFVAR